MTEKKLLVDGLRFTYSGMFDFEEIFKEIDDWTNKNGFERETKKKLEHVEADGKKLDYIFELWKQIKDFAKAVVRVRILCRDVVDFDLERNDTFKRMQKGTCIVIIDGFLETDIESRWIENPWNVFTKTLWDKIVWNFWMSRYDGYVNQPSHDLFGRLQAFFKRHKY